MPQSQDDRQIGSDSEGSEEFDGGPEAEADWDDWNGGGGDVGDEDLATSLFSPTVLPSPEAAMDHDAAQHGFDIRKYAIQVTKYRQCMSCSLGDNLMCICLCVCTLHACAVHAGGCSVLRMHASCARMTADAQ